MIEALPVITADAEAIGQVVVHAGFFFQLLLLGAVMLLNLLFGPKRKKDRAEVTEQDDPRASAGATIKQIFGCIETSEQLVILDTDKTTNTYKTRG